MLKINREKTVAFTGNRELTAPQGVDGHNLKTKISKQVYSLIEQAYHNGKRVFLSGMAQGFDMMAAEAVLRLQEEYPDVELIAVIPFLGQDATYPYIERRRYDQILDMATDQIVIWRGIFSPAAYHKRNDYLVENSSYVIAYSNGIGTGAASTVKKAKASGLRVDNIFENLR